jgi:uncharacterized protein YidB (DUF937 family)
MGLLDVLNGMQKGPRGPSTPSEQSSGGGMSPMTMAILGLLAWKAFKHLTAPGAPGPASVPSSAPTPSQMPPPSGGALGGAPGSGSLGGGGLGGLGDVLKGPLGGLLGGAAAGTALSGGLSDLLKQLQDSGHGEKANSWVGTGTNQQISSGDLANALGADQIEHLSAQSGLSRDDLLSGLSQYLPQVVDHLTPDGRLPTEDELSGRL